MNKKQIIASFSTLPFSDPDLELFMKNHSIGGPPRPGKVSNIRRTKSQNLNASRLIL